MTREQLEREVACITGESLAEIRRRGFSLAHRNWADFDNRDDGGPPQFIDWDEPTDHAVSLFP